MAATATTWRELRGDPQRWLLANGAEITSPPLEITTTGRRVRIVGETKSVTPRNQGDLVWNYVLAEARRRKTKPWLRIKEFGNRERERHPVLHFARHSDLRSPWRGETTLWWHFQHPVLPIRATLTLTMFGANHYSADVSAQKVGGSLEFPDTTPEHARTGRWVKSVEEVGRSSAPHGAGLIDAETRDKIRTWVEANPPEWGIEEALSDFVEFPTARAGVAEFLRRVRLVEDIDRLRIPDLRGEPTWLTLDLVDTNVTGELVESLVSFLDSEPAIRKALAAYQEFQAALRQAGLVLQSTTTDQLMAALHAGADAIQVPLGSAAAPNGHDPHHQLTVRLASGTFVVTCQHRADESTKDPNIVADRWQEAQAIASITGKEDELLAYARGYAMQSETLRTRDVLSKHV